VKPPLSRLDRSDGSPLPRLDRSGGSPLPRLVLASGSPRRRQLLGELGLDFEVRPPATDETALPGERPEEMVERLAREKALARLEPGELVLAADTIVVIGGRILGKPADAEEARSMLGGIAGREHEVFTGVALAEGARFDGFDAGGRAQRRAALRFAFRLARTRVTMRSLSAEEIADYVATGEPLDKAGAYGIQGLGALLVDSVNGNYLNVVGLPLPAVAECFADLGWRLLDFRRAGG
jgi:septum formation protein